MKFASIRYCSTVNELKINGLIKKLPKSLLDYYIKRINPCSWKDVTLLNAEGFEVTLPLLENESESNIQKWDIVVKKTLEQLKEEGVEIIIPPNVGGFLNPSIRVADGKAIFALLMNQSLEKALKIRKKSKKDSQIVLIDGGNFLSKLVMDSIYPHVNFLSVYTDREEYFADKIAEVYEETGLTLQVFTNCKNTLLKEADVILNTADDIENYDYYFQKGAIYFDVNKNKQKLKRLRSKRQDMFFADGIELKIANNYYTAEVFEAAEYVNSKELREFLTRQYDEDKAALLRKNIESRSMSISAFRCMGNTVKPMS